MSTALPLITAYEKEHLFERQPLPERYVGLSDEEMDVRIAAAKAALGRSLVILGHHYQRDEVIKFADYTGDSYKLARHVAAHPDAKFIVFCGVHFMAESADVLSAPDQQVILPDLAAGVAFYGSAPNLEDVPKIKAAMLIQSAEVDERINAAWPACEAALKAANVRYERFLYPGTQHGFNNDTTPRYDANAAKLAWERTLAHFNKHLR